ncbi:AAA family ATPase [Lactobacillus taiwanensis]|uniref:AAA family ATPase n=1 Tax=Lactobacillus taiwanensis TaxID=508451 RepID=UPI00321FEEE7
MSAEVEFIGRLGRVRWSAPDSDFKIAEVVVVKLLEGKIDTPYEFLDYVVVKGDFNMQDGVNYNLTVEVEHNSKWGDQYNLLFLQRENPVENMDKNQFKEFLGQITKYAEKICDKYDDPREIFEKHDYDALCEIEGIGMSTAEKLFVLYDNERDYSQAYSEFGRYGFSPEFVRKVVGLERSVEKAVEHLNENPYYFMRYGGIGFKLIDNKALAQGMSVNDPRRVHAFIYDFFDELESEGTSWIYAEKLRDYLRKEVYKVDIKDAMDFISKSDDFVVFKRSKGSCIATKRLFNLEKQVGEELVRLLNSKCKFELKNAENIIANIEKEQGWQYSEAQRRAIDLMLNQNVFLLQGLSGAGKSSTLNAVVKVFQENGIMVNTCALSGKAADNLTQITGKNGSTIHSLLGATIDSSGSIFNFNKYKKLPSQVIILDEVSMVNIGLFYALISAISSGAKLIMVGDNAQLDSIGVGVMKGIMDSKVVPTTILKEIHRQAKESAVVTHSLDYRNGEIPKELEIKPGFKRYGKKQDLGYMFVDDTETKDINKRTYSIFAQAFKKYDVKDIQVITPITSSGTVNCFMINNMCQAFANPAKEGEPKVEVKIGKDKVYKLRVGDKVINTKNVRDTTDPTSQTVIPIYNGNTGIVKNIEVDEKNGETKDIRMVIDFDGIGEVLVENSAVRNIQLGYCITVHKSQGSTIPCVIVAMPYHYKLGSRELLYTALTRASNEAILVTTAKALRFATKSTSKKVRHDNVSAMIKYAKKGNS